MATFPPSGFTIDAIICDSAVTADGKLYIQGGGWNMLASPAVPFVQPRVGVALIVGVPYTGTNKNHRLELRLENEDGERLALGPEVAADVPGATKSPMGIVAQFNVGRPAILQAGDSQNIPFAINLDQLAFRSPGAYSFVISINDEEIERLTFRVLGPQGATITATGGA
jgi:hypothetical protein